MEIPDSLVAQKRGEFYSFSYQKNQKTLKFSVDQQMQEYFFCFSIFKLMSLIFQTKLIYNLFNFFIINNKTKYSVVYLL